MADKPNILMKGVLNMGRHLSKENQKKRIDRIVELRDSHNLEFGIIAERLGVAIWYCRTLYYEEKNRIRNA